MTLTNKLLIGLTGLVLLVSLPESSQSAIAKDKKKDVQSESNNNKPDSTDSIIRFGVDTDFMFNLNPIKVDAQGKYIRIYPDETYRTHRIGSNVAFSAGPLINLFSIIEFGARYNFTTERKGEERTYWSETRPINYSCVGGFDIKMSKWIYSVTLQTKEPSYKHNIFSNNGIRFFISYMQTDFDMNGHDNYSINGQPVFAQNSFNAGNYTLHYIGGGIRFSNKGITNHKVVDNTELSFNISVGYSYITKNNPGEFEGINVKDGGLFISAGASITFNTFL